MPHSYLVVSHDGHFGVALESDDHGNDIGYRIVEKVDGAGDFITVGDLHPQVDLAEDEIKRIKKHV